MTPGVVVVDAASCGTGYQISPNIRVLTGLRPPLVTLSPGLRFTYGSVAANMSAPAPLQGQAKHTNCLKGGIFCLLLTVFETSVCHLRHLCPTATVESLAQNLCDCPSHPWVSSTENLVKYKAPRQSCDFCPFRACLLVAVAAASCQTHRSTLDTKRAL